MYLWQTDRITGLTLVSEDSYRALCPAQRCVIDSIRSEFQSESALLYGLAGATRSGEDVRLSPHFLDADATGRTAFSVHSSEAGAAAAACIFPADGRSSFRAPCWGHWRPALDHTGLPSALIVVGQQRPHERTRSGQPARQLRSSGRAVVLFVTERPRPRPRQTTHVLPVPSVHRLPLLCRPQESSP